MINLVEITMKKVDTQVSRKKNKNKNINHSVFAYIAYKKSYLKKSHFREWKKEGEKGKRGEKPDRDG